MKSFSSVLRPVRRSISVGLCILIVAINCVGTALAQDQTKPDDSQNGQGSENSKQTAVIETRTKSYVLEGLIFAALCGGAIYAVCRSSPRGN